MILGGVIMEDVKTVLLELKKEMCKDKVYCGTEISGNMYYCRNCVTIHNKLKRLG